MLWTGLRHGILNRTFKTRFGRCTALHAMVKWAKFVSWRSSGRICAHWIKTDEPHFIWLQSTGMHRRSRCWWSWELTYMQRMYLDEQHFIWLLITGISSLWSCLWSWVRIYAHWIKMETQRFIWLQTMGTHRQRRRWWCWGRIYGCLMKADEHHFNWLPKMGILRPWRLSRMQRQSWYDPIDFNNYLNHLVDKHRTKPWCYCTKFGWLFVFSPIQCSCQFGTIQLILSLVCWIALSTHPAWWETFRGLIEISTS